MHARMYIYMPTIIVTNTKLYVPEVGHNKHCPAEAYETPDNS